MCQRYLLSKTVNPKLNRLLRLPAIRLQARRSLNVALNNCLGNSLNVCIETRERLQDIEPESL